MVHPGKEEGEEEEEEEECVLAGERVHLPTKRSMGTLRPVLESIFTVFDGGDTATSARGQAHMILCVIFYWIHRVKKYGPSCILIQ